MYRWHHSYYSYLMLFVANLFNLTLMKKKLTITGIFNDVFTNYEDKESSVSMIVDTDDCQCTELRKCWMHRDSIKYVITDISEEDEKRLKINTLNIMKKLKQKLVEWLLKDITLGYSIKDNNVTGSQVMNNTISLKTSGNIILQDKIIPEGFEIIIRKSE